MRGDKILEREGVLNRDILILCYRFDDAAFRARAWKLGL